MPQRNRSVPTVLVAVALCWACGGRASDGDRTIEPDDGPAPDDVQALPDALEELELRLARMGDPSSGSLSCNLQAGAEESASPDPYSMRVHVNFQTREMLLGSCILHEETVETGMAIAPLVDGDLARIEDAYRELRVLGSAQCTARAEYLTLNLIPEPGTLLLYGDEHSDCPPSQRDGFVSGLRDLYSLLESIASAAP